MFWWYYESPNRIEDPKKPWLIILWLQGGPGASGVGIGNFEETGPLMRSLIMLIGIIASELPRIEMLILTRKVIQRGVIKAVEVMPKSESQQKVWAKYREMSNISGSSSSFEPLPSQTSCSYEVRFEDIGHCLRCECIMTDVFGRSGAPEYAETAPVLPGQEITRYHTNRHLEVGGQKRGRMNVDNVNEGHQRKKIRLGVRATQWISLYNARQPMKHRYHYNVSDARLRQHVEKGYQDSLFICVVSSCANLWALIMDGGTNFSSQVFEISPNCLHKEWIMENWDKNFYISCLAGFDKSIPAICYSLYIYTGRLKYYLTMNIQPKPYATPFPPKNCPDQSSQARLNFLKLPVIRNSSGVY